VFGKGWDALLIQFNTFYLNWETLSIGNQQEGRKYFHKDNEGIFDNIVRQLKIKKEITK
jgi:hypothetical protein